MVRRQIHGFFWNAVRRKPIPPLFHYCWFGGAPPSPEMDACLESWRRWNPTYEVMRWDEGNVPDDPFVERALRGGHWSRASNAVRAHAVLKFGGIYLDTDVEIRRDFEPLRRLSCFLGFQYEPDGTPYKPFEMCVNGAVLGARPGHPFVKDLLARIPRKIEGPEAFDVLGPQMTTAALIDLGLQAYSASPITLGGVTVFPKEAFYPYFYREGYDPRTVGPETFAVHHWAKRW
jgi:mannosyltransferase OCH1-like enzyme